MLVTTSVYAWKTLVLTMGTTANMFHVSAQGGRNLGETLSGSSAASSSSSGHRQLQLTQSSTEWRPGSGSLSLSGPTVESGLALFAGKKVLLVEVCNMVRLLPSWQLHGLCRPYSITYFALHYIRCLSGHCTVTYIAYFLSALVFSSVVFGLHRILWYRYSCGCACCMFFLV